MNLITDHLDTWTSAIKKKSSAGRGGGKKQEFYGVKKLRELILELAVRGLLVPQDPKDEPAAQLLTRISKEQDRLVKQGQIKKQKNLLSVILDQVPFDAPQGWEWTKLGELLNRISNGYSGKQDKSGNGYPLTRIETISDSSVNTAKVGYSSGIPENKLEYYKLEGGDILLSHINSDYHVGKTAVFDGGSELYHGVNLLLLRPSEFSNSRFLDISINQLRLSGYFIEIAQHAIGQASINQKKVVEKLVCLPPLAEQQRIVAKVDELMALCDQLEQQQEDSVRTHGTLVQTLLGALTAASERGQFEQAWHRIASHFDTLFTTESSITQLKQTILQLAVMGKLVEQDPEDEPASGLLKALRAEKMDLIKRKVAKDSGKLHQKAPESPAYNIPESWEWVRFRELIWCYRGHNPPKSEFIYEPKDGYVRFVQITDFKTDKSAVYVPMSRENKLVKKDEIIMAAYRHIGKLSRDMEGAFNVALCKILEFQPMSRDYVELMIGTDVVKGELLRASERGHIPSMHSDHLLSLLVPLPPLAEQHRIVAKVDELMTLCDRLKASLQTAQATQLHLADSLVEQAIR